MKRESRNNRGKIYILALVASALMLAPQSWAATHYVSQTSPNPTPPYSTPDTAAHTAQQAVDVACDGDTVLVETGGCGLTNRVTSPNAIQLQGAGGASPTFLTGLSNIWCLGISNSLGIVDGFTLQDPYIADVPHPNGAILM